MFEFSISLIDQAFFLVLGLLGLISCFFGFRLFRVWLALAGFQIGFFLCFSFGGQVFNPTHLLIMAALCGVLLAGGLSIFSRVGGVFAGAGVMILLIDQLLRLIPIDLSTISLYIYITALLVGALLGFLRIRLFHILTTAFAGGWLVSFCVGGIVAVWPVGQAVAQYDRLQGGGQVLLLIGTIVLMIFGTLIQLALNRKALKVKPKPVTASAPETESAAPSLVLPDESPVEAPVEAVAEVVEKADETKISES